MKKYLIYLLISFTGFLCASTPNSLAIRSIIKETLEKTLTHVSEIIDQAEVIEDPFPHIVIEGIFSEEFYELASALWPDESEFVSQGQRLILPVTYGCAEQTNMTKQQKAFWRIFGEIVINKHIKPKIAMKFKTYFTLKHGLKDYEYIDFDYMQDAINFRQDGLLIDLPKYELKPHVDQCNIIAAMFIYFPLDWNHQDFGTTFFYGKPSTNPNQILYSEQNTSLSFAKTLPYRPNTLVAFLQTPFSWHGVINKGVEPTYRRRLYVSPIFFSPEFMAKNVKNYNRSFIDEYFFDHRFLSKIHWSNIWGNDE